MNEADEIAERVTLGMVQQALNEAELRARTALASKENLLYFSKQLALHIVDDLVESETIEPCECMNPLRPRDLARGYCSYCSRRVSIVVWRVV